MIAGRLSLNYGKYMAAVSTAFLTFKNLKPSEELVKTCEELK